MKEYLIRKATINDTSFLTDVVIAAEKGNSDKLSYSTLFNLSEERVAELIKNMFEEEIDGCEFSISSFIIIEYEEEPVAAFGGWIEGFNNSLPSKILKSNLLSYTFGSDSIEFLKTKSGIIKELVSEREPMALQLEFLYVSENHRGKRLADKLIHELEKNALSEYAGLKKVQVQVFKNNIHAVRVYEKNGFEVAASYKSHNIEVLNYLPFNEKYVMEKKL